MIPSLQKITDFETSLQTVNCLTNPDAMTSKIMLVDMLQNLFALPEFMMHLTVWAKPNALQIRVGGDGSPLHHQQKETAKRSFVSWAFAILNMGCLTNSPLYLFVLALFPSPETYDNVQKELGPHLREMES